MTKFSGILLCSIFSFFLFAGSAMAVPSLGEYEIFTADPFGAPAYTAGNDLGYFIWTSDVLERRDWHIRWSSDGTLRTFRGSIKLEENELTNVSEFSFESDTLLTGIATATWLAFAENSEDGIDFSIKGSKFPSYLGFDLEILNVLDVTPFVHIGAGNVNPESADFKISAPIPEPATMLLLGSGLIGMAVIGRKKLLKK